MINRKIAPKINLVDKIDLTEPEYQVLDNGIKVYALKGGEKEILKIEVVFNAGRYDESAPIIASLTSKMLKEGTLKYNSKSIAESLDYYGATVNVGSDYDHAYINIFCLNRFLIPIMEVVEQIIYYPTFPEEEMEKIAKRSIENLKVNEEKIDYLASVRFRELFYGKKHPYGYRVVEDHFLNASINQLNVHYNNLYSTEDTKVFISGKWNKGDLKIIQKKLNKPGNSRLANTPPEIPDYKVYEEIVKKKNALQSAIRIGKPIVERTHKDFYTLKVLNSIFGGYFGSRLMSNIREDKGYTYGIYSFFSSMKHQNFMQISTEVNNDVTENAVDEIFMELNRLTIEKVEEEELQLVKNYLTGRIMQTVDGPFKSIDTLKGLYLNDLGITYFHNYVSAINNITTEQLLACAQKYFQKEDFSLVIARN